MSTKSKYFSFLKPLRLPKANPYVTVVVLFTLLGSALVYELNAQYDKTLADASQRAMQRSLIVSQTLYSKLIATDYVLRDVLGRIQTKDLMYPDPDPKHLQKITQLLKEKSSTVPGLTTMVLFNKDCVFTALDTGEHMGAKSSQVWCDSAKAHSDSTPMISFVPANKSPSGVGVVAFSRIIRSSTGEFEGAAVSAMEVGALQKWIDTISINPNDTVSLIDKSRTLLARNPKFDDRMQTEVSVPELDVIENNPSTTVSSHRVGVDGQSYVMGFSKVEDFPLYIAYGFNKNAILAQWRLHSTELIASYLVIFLLVLLAVRLQVKSQKSRLEIEREKSKLEEREYLLQDMHDGFGSQLASAHLMAQQGEMTQEQIKGILQECMSDLYLVMDTLSSAGSTFIDVIADYRYRLERRLGAISIALHWDVHLQEISEVSPRITLQLLRILQEAISNILKHSHAKNAWIDIRYSPEDEMLRMTVTDDGLGLPATAHKGRGLPGMKGRARAIGATFTASSRSEGPGVQVSLTLKMPH